MADKQIFKILFTKVNCFVLNFFFTQTARFNFIYINVCSMPSTWLGLNVYFKIQLIHIFKICIATLEVNNVKVL